MGFISALLSGGQGAGFQAQQPISTAQAGALLNRAQGGLDLQSAFIQALAAQNGIGNQSSVFNQAQALANGPLAAMAAGQGPNPALAQLATATGANNANTAALMAGQRGSGANAGLIARQAAQQGAANNQQAAGQAATLAAQQQLAGINALQNQQQLLGGLSSQQVGQQANAIGNYNTGAQGLLNTAVGSIGGVNAANSGIAAQNAKSQAGLVGGLLSGVGSAFGSFNQGGEVPEAGEMSQECRVVGHLLNMRAGGKVPGKAPVSGDSPANDIVPAKLSPGEIVIPRSHAADPEKAAAFARSVAMKSRKGKK